MITVTAIAPLLRLLQVGYSIRFEDCTSPDTIIKYMTDGARGPVLCLDRVSLSFPPEES